MRTVRIGKLKLPVVQLVSVIAVLGILVFMLYMAPLRLDDWAWGGNIGLDRLSSGFEGYNGRYAGDIVVILLTRIPALLRAIVETTVLVSIAFNAYLILRKSPTAFSVFLMAFSLMPLMIFTQTVTWAAGFANFVFSLAIMMYLLRVFLQVDGGAKQGALKSAYVLVIVFVGQLFLENITLYTICLCIVFTVRSIKNRSSRSFFVLALACSLGGALLMFSNSAYMSAFAGDGDSYKTIGVAGSGFLSTLKQWAKTYAYDIVPSWMSSCGPACILLALGGIGLSATKRSKMSCIAITVGVFILGACLYSIVDGEWFTMIERGVYIRALLYSMLYLYVLIVLMLFSKDRFKTLLIAFSQILIVGPLLLVNPIGPRCFLASYALWCLLAALMAKQAVNELIPLDELSMQHWRSLDGN